MSKPNRKRLKLETIRAQRLEAEGDKYVEIEFEDEQGDEQVVRLLRQTWWPLPLMKQLTSLRALVKEDGTVDDDQAMSGIERTVAVLRQTANDKALFDQLATTLTVGDFQDIMELITSEDEGGMDEGKSGSSSN
ncbi:hypothetical protein ACFYXS_02875 [Streptomyces sp. NPDC002574]|uniref:hypothetical protein n=1 Tax=Streptomyces sp. NPDC002574 TaxID=3364652 RepID=UPI0036A8660B